MTETELSYFKPGPRILNRHFVIDPTEMPLWNLSYSMFGEDLILRGMMKAKLKSGVPGFYADLGCYDARYGNNTYLFYRYGWRGICVEANPDPVFRKQYATLRPKDVFINAAIGEAGRGYWGKSESAAASRVGLTLEEFGAEYKELVGLEFLPLKAIFDQHVPPGTEIDFISIDVEGSELSVLRSNDWNKYRPKIILMEENTLDVLNLSASAPVAYLQSLGYKVEGAMFPNVVLSAR